MNTKKLKKYKKKTKLNKRKHNQLGGVPNPFKGEGEKMKMRAKATGKPALNKTKDFVHGVLTMENPIVFAYQFIERNVFGMDTVAPERKMSATQKSMFGDKLTKNKKKSTLKEFVKGKYENKGE